MKIQTNALYDPLVSSVLLGSLSFMDQCDLQELHVTNLEYKMVCFQ